MRSGAHTISITLQSLTPRPDKTQTVGRKGKQVRVKRYQWNRKKWVKKRKNANERSKFFGVSSSICLLQKYLLSTYCAWVRGDAGDVIAHNKSGAGDLLPEGTTIKELQDLVQSAMMEPHEVLQKHTGAQVTSKLKWSVSALILSSWAVRSSRELMSRSRVKMTKEERPQWDVRSWCRASGPGDFTAAAGISRKLSCSHQGPKAS